MMTNASSPCLAPIGMPLLELQANRHRAAHHHDACRQQP